ncbi:hypothetical protein OVA14_05115 [Agrococcus sp. SL85]|uniref:hypothetical protein n=1 Tax=Agrococcus sp. SL85 TaxID=2995141 RepID=UPI00226D3C43|nr:hypothetical protein [Agrococcus sp. SL85]WAC67129.1 hypothetical protein OVA14_05115 [Agrococcus sp. SL85]
MRSGLVRAATALVLATMLAGCAPGALAPGDERGASAEASPSAAADASATPTASPTPTLDAGAGPDDVAVPAPTPDAAPPTPGSCDDIGASPLAARWVQQGFALEPFDGIIVGGGFPAATAAGGELAVHCILWTAAGARGPHVLVELYRGAPLGAVLADPSVAHLEPSTLATAHGDIVLADSGGFGISSSQETVGGHDDVVLRTFTVGFPTEGAAADAMNGPLARGLLFESAFGVAAP